LLNHHQRSQYCFANNPSNIWDESLALQFCA
jgi:hypothetical protein